MKSRSKFLTVLFCIVFVLISTVCSGCGYKGYSGENVDLYTVAINSVLWNVGNSYGADFARDSEINVIEKDEYGRTLFTYHEKYYVESSLCFSALIVSQYSSDGYVYYYEDCNYIIKEHINIWEAVDFEQDEINEIKELNDWNNELDLSKCTKKEINKNKPKIPTDSDAIKNKAIEELGTKDEIRVHLFYLTGDNNDNFIIYGTVTLDADSYVHFVAFVTSDGEIKEWLVPQEPYNYQNELKELKIRNGWTNK